MRCGVVVDNDLNSDIRVLREIRILKQQGFEIFVLCFGFHPAYSTTSDKISVTRIFMPKKLKDILFFLLNTIPVYEWLWTFWVRKFIIEMRLMFFMCMIYIWRRLHTMELEGQKKAYRLFLIFMRIILLQSQPTTGPKDFSESSFQGLTEWQKKEIKYLTFADRIIVLSADYRDLLLNRYPGLSKEKFTVLPNVPDLSQINKTGSRKIQIPFSQSFPVLFYYGVIAERRGVFDALEVFSGTDKG